MVWYPIPTIGELKKEKKGTNYHPSGWWFDTPSPQLVSWKKKKKGHPLDINILFYLIGDPFFSFTSSFVGFGF